MDRITDYNETEDRIWLTELVNRYKKELNSTVEQVLDGKGRIYVIRPFAFINITYLQDGTKVINEVAVHPNHKNNKYGYELVQYVGKPCIVACYDEIIGFYLKCGFVEFGKLPTNDGLFTVLIRE